MRKATQVRNIWLKEYAKGFYSIQRVIRSIGAAVARLIRQEAYCIKNYKGLSRKAQIRFKRRCVRLYGSLGALVAVFAVTLALNADRSVGYIVMADTTPIGVTPATNVVEVLNSNLYTESTTEIKVLPEPIVYNSKKTDALTTEQDIQDKVREQQELAFLERMNAEAATTTVAPVETTATTEINAEPAALIDEDVLDRNANNVLPIVVEDDVNGAKPVVGAVEPIELIDVQEIEDENITAYAVYIDDEYIGTVEDPAAIEETLALLKVPYLDTENLVSLSFSKNVTCDKQIEMKRSMLTDPEVIAAKLLSTEGVKRTYEVIPGDCPSIIADKLGVDLDTLYSYPATMNGELIADLADDCRVGMQIEYASERKYIHVLVEKDTEYTDMIGYKTFTIEDDTLFEGVAKVDVVGEYGEMHRVCREIIDDGVIISSTETQLKMIKEPVDEVVRVGTRKTVTEVNTSTYAGGSGSYFWPVGNNEGYISAYMGDGRGHKGQDIAAPYGTPIYAAASGTIKTTNTSGWGSGYGKYVMINNDDGYTCMYGHMSYLAEGIKEGVYVVEGQLIGYVGSTGDSTGNHLHFEVRSGGSFLNPANFISK